MQNNKTFVNTETKDKKVNILIRFLKGDWGNHIPRVLNHSTLTKCLKEDDLLEHFKSSDKIEL